MAYQIIIIETFWVKYMNTAIKKEHPTSYTDEYRMKGKKNLATLGASFIATLFIRVARKII